MYSFLEETKFNVFWFTAGTLDDISSFLSGYEAKDEKAIREEFEDILKDIGSRIKKIADSMEGFKDRKLYWKRGDKLFQNPNFKNQEDVFFHIAGFLDLVAYFTGLKSKPNWFGPYTILPTGDVKGLDDIDQGDLAQSIPPILEALDRKAMKMYGQTLSEIHEEAKDRLHRGRAEMKRKELLKSSHSCPHCGASKKYKEKDIIEGTNAKVICQNKKCKQEFIIQDIEVLFTEE